MASDFYSTASPRNASIISLHLTKPEHDLKQEKKKRLKLRRSRANNTNGATKTLIIVKGNQEVDKSYLKQHNGFRTILKALKHRIQTLKVRRHNGSVRAVSSPSVDADRIGDSLRLSQDSTPGNVASANPERSGSTQGLVAVDPEVDKKEEVGNYGETEVTELRSSSGDDDLHWDILGTIHSYEGPTKVFSKPRAKPKTLKISDDETPLSALPLYDNRVLKEATSGLRIFVNVSEEAVKEPRKKPTSTRGESTLSGSVDDTENNEGLSSIPADELFNEDEAKGSEKLDRLLSNEKATDAIAKEIAQLLTDDPSGSSEDPSASTDDLAVVSDDLSGHQPDNLPSTSDNAPEGSKDLSTKSAESTKSDDWSTKSDDSSTKSDDSPTTFESSQTPSVSALIAADDTVASSDKSLSSTMSSATQKCLGKRDSTECTISAICCSVCCQAG